MRLLFVIPHHYEPKRGARHGSSGANPRARVQAITLALASIHQLFGRRQGLLRIDQRRVVPAGERHDVDIVVCTTAGSHLLETVTVPNDTYEHRVADVDPVMLGFECHRVLRERLGSYDFYCYLEDDVILHDPTFFSKLRWFTDLFGDISLLQPNRYEVAARGSLRKVYIDGDIAGHVTARFQDVTADPLHVVGVFSGRLELRRPLNPHASSFFLNAEQMAMWESQPYFLDGDTSFIGPLESAATLGIMRTFRVYKPRPENFLEIQHFGTSFISLIARGEVTDAQDDDAP